MTSRTSRRLVQHSGRFVLLHYLITTGRYTSLSSDLVGVAVGVLVFVGVAVGVLVFVDVGDGV